MQISSRFPIAIHILSCAAYFSDQKVTSSFLAGSIGCNPVVVRQILGMLKKAGLIQIRRGSGGIHIEKPLDQITLFDIYHAVEAVDEKGLFRYHENPNPSCPIGRQIHSLLEEPLDRIEQAMETEMKKTTMSDILRKAKYESE